VYAKGDIMADSRPATRTVTVADIEGQLAPLLRDIDRGELRVLVEQEGIPIAAIISVRDLERFDRLERERDERFAVIDRMREAFADVPIEEIEREAERSVAEARDRLRRRADELTARTA
jgi:antitoxin (DNA-binding transcriptional repressor) of toxin-antitoxin stability system